MKNYQAVESRGPRVEGKNGDATFFFHPRPSALDPRQAFTLIELLVVITIIGILAALLMPLGAAVRRTAFINKTKAEMAQVETAIESYKAAYGFYPPDNPGHPLLNQLYYELIGTTNTSPPTVSPIVFQPLDGNPAINGSQLNSMFGNVNAILNCSKPGAGEDTQPARSFIHELKPGQTGTNTNSVRGSPPVILLVGSVGGPDQSYKPLGASGLNPWRYNSSSPTNNPGAYDLYIQLVIGGKTNLICNWSKQVQINNPLP